MDPTLQAALAALIGAVVAGGAVLAWHISDRQQRTIPPYAQPVVPDGVGTVLSVLRSSAVVVDDSDEVLKASAPAYALGLVRGSKLVSADLADVVRKVRRDGQIRETELLMARPGVPSRYVTARVAPLGSRLVLALVEDRTREKRVEEVRRDFVANVLGPEGMKRSVVVAATSDRSPVERRRCPLAAMTIAEHFRDRGAHVLFLADSITRFAEAHREVAIASGELPALRGFPASMAHQIMQLAERAGPGVGHSGDITGIFSVLVAASDMDEPVADVLRGVLDGHVVLDRQIAERGRFPAIDILRSVSRSLPEAASTDENALISQTRQLLGAYSGAETMIRAGLYREGSDPLIDQAIRAWPEIEGFIGEDAHTDIATCFSRLRLILRRVSASPGRAAGPRSNGQSSQVAPRARS